MPVVVLGMITMQRSVSVRSDKRVLTHGYYAPSKGCTSALVDQLLSRPLGATIALRERYGYDGVCMLSTEADLLLVRQLCHFTATRLRAAGTGRMEDLECWAAEPVPHSLRAVVHHPRRHAPPRLKTADLVVKNMDVAPRVEGERDIELVPYSDYANAEEVDAPVPVGPPSSLEALRRCVEMRLVDKALRVVVPSYAEEAPGMLDAADPAASGDDAPMPSAGNSDATGPGDGSASDSSSGEEGAGGEGTAVRLKAVVAAQHEVALRTQHPEAQLSSRVMFVRVTPEMHAEWSVAMQPQEQSDEGEDDATRTGGGARRNTTRRRTFAGMMAPVKRYIKHEVQSGRLPAAVGMSTVALVRPGRQQNSNRFNCNPAKFAVAHAQQMHPTPEEPPHGGGRGRGGAPRARAPPSRYRMVWAYDVAKQCAVAVVRTVPLDQLRLPYIYHKVVLEGEGGSSVRVDAVLVSDPAGPEAGADDHDMDIGDDTEQDTAGGVVQDGVVEYQLRGVVPLKVPLTTPKAEELHGLCAAGGHDAARMQMLDEMLELEDVRRWLTKHLGDNVDAWGAGCLEAASQVVWDNGADAGMVLVADVATAQHNKERMAPPGATGAGQWSIVVDVRPHALPALYVLATAAAPEEVVPEADRAEVERLLALLNQRVTNRAADAINRTTATLVAVAALAPSAPGGRVNKTMVVGAARRLVSCGATTPAQDTCIRVAGLANTRGGGNYITVDLPRLEFVQRVSSVGNPLPMPGEGDAERQPVFVRLTAAGEAKARELLELLGEWSRSL